MALDEVSDDSCETGGGCSFAFGLVMGIGALAEFLVAMADARAR